MPITSQVDKTKNLTIYTLVGKLALADILNAIKSFWEAHELTLAMDMENLENALKSFMTVREYAQS